MCVCVCAIMFVRQDEAQEEDARACASCMRALSPQDNSSSRSSGNKIAGSLFDFCVVFSRGW